MVDEFGDFQTPTELVGDILTALDWDTGPWTRVLEPTCGTGNFVAGALRRPRRPEEVIGLEIQPRYVLEAAARFEQERSRVSINEVDAFRCDLGGLDWRTSGPLLVVGNLPWVTNAALGSIASPNIPTKDNPKKLRGLDAVTGEANFDVAEYLWLKLLRELAPSAPTIALLCKTAVARKVLEHAWRTGVPVSRADIYDLDAARWFGVSVDACLLRVDIGATTTKAAGRFGGISSRTRMGHFGLVENQLVADFDAYQAVSYAHGKSPVEWRQGIKHDAARAMELKPLGHDGSESQGCSRYVNGFGEEIELEDADIFPLAKCSDLFNDRLPPARRLIVPHRRLGDDTEGLRKSAPRTWAYLQRHRALFDGRKSSIYRGKPPFSIFGVGDYSFASYKVAVSGLHKQARFRLVGPVDGKPVVFDDTCYILPSNSALEASLLASLLDAAATGQLLRAIVFWDNKRPLTKKVLQRVDLCAVLRQSDPDDIARSAGAKLAGIGMNGEHVDWTQVMHEFLETHEASVEAVTA